MKIEKIGIGKLKNHPRNYREHNDDQLAHIIQSIEENGIYKNIVISKDNYILAGHGVLKALRRLNKKTVDVYRVELNHNDTQALKILAGDNEIARLGHVDIKELINILSEIDENDINGLIGTGFDDMMLTNMAMVSRSRSELEKTDEYEEWIGMPEYEPRVEPIKMTVNFKTHKAKKEFAKKLNVKISAKTKSMWWPEKEKEDVASVRYE